MTSQLLTDATNALTQSNLSSGPGSVHDLIERLRDAWLHALASAPQPEGWVLVTCPKCGYTDDHAKR